MRLASKRALAGVGGALAIVALAAVPTIGSDDVVCMGVAPPSVPHDLIVPPNGSCTILFGSTVGHDVKVMEGATLDDHGAHIGHDVTAKKPKGISVNGGGMQGSGYVGHDVRVDGVTDDGTPAMKNTVCNNHILHDVVITNSTMTAAPWVIGDRHSTCGGGADFIDHDLVIQGNADSIDVMDNQPATQGNIGHDLVMKDNSGGVVANDNHAGHDCTQKNNHPYMGMGNTADHSVDACNSANP